MLPAVFSFLMKSADCPKTGCGLYLTVTLMPSALKSPCRVFFFSFQ